MTPAHPPGRLRAATRRRAGAPASTARLPVVHPSSFMQRQLWWRDQRTPGGSAAMNMPYVLRVRGLLEVAVLRRALREIAARHDVLRTTFTTADGVPVQVVSDDPAVNLTIHSAADLPAARRRQTVQRWVEAEVNRPFNLSTDRLLRAVLYPFGEREHVLCLTFHHIIFDGWSTQLFFSELSQLYHAFGQGRPSPLPPLPTQFGDYARWQHERLAGPAVQQQRTYWHRQLAGAPPLLALPTDRPRPARQPISGAAYETVIPAGLAQALRALGRAEAASLFMVVLAGLQVVLARHSRQADFCLGTPVAGRLLPALEPLLGVFPNLLVLRADLTGKPSFQELVKRARQTALAAYEHQEVPFRQLLDELYPEQSGSYLPLVNVLFATQNTPRRQLLLGELEVEMEFLPTKTSRCDLFVNVIDDGEAEAGDLRVFVEYSDVLFDRATVGTIVADLLRVLAQAVREPDRPVAELARPGPEPA